jgi:hypothetical protein
MNRLYNQFFLSLERGKAVLFGKVAIGATGAPTINAVKSKGIASIARNSTGNYTITLNDRYVDMFKCGVQFLFATDPAVCRVYIVSQAVNSTKAIVIQCVDNANAAVDPANGAEMSLEIVLKTSTAP